MLKGTGATAEFSEKLPLTAGQRTALTQAEQSGRLAETLTLLADSDQRLEAMRLKAWGAARYPIAIGGLSLLVMTGLLVGIVPQFEALYGRFGAELPLATKLLLEASRFIMAWGLVMLFGLIAAGISIQLMYRRHPPLRLAWHRLLNTVPGLGRLRHELAGLAFSEGMQLYLAAGLPSPRR